MIKSMIEEVSKKKLFVIYSIEKDGRIGYKPVKFNLQAGSRICLDKDTWKFASVVKTVESTPEIMHKAWETAQAVRHFSINSFEKIFEDYVDFFNL